MMLSVQCSVCGRNVHSWDEVCSSCNNTLDPPPNVRMAEDVKANLEARYARVRRTLPQARLDELEDLALRDGRVVVNMRYTALREMLESGSVRYGNYWCDFITERITDRNREFVARRMEVDAHLFGVQCKEIRCGQLSHDRTGASFYGRFAVTLKTELIDRRTSLLEDNPFNVPVPSLRDLLRATWSSRQQLVAVRYGPAAAARPTEPVKSVVAVVGSDRTGQSFVEANVWGSFTSAAFEGIIVQLPVGGPDKRLRADIGVIRDFCEDQDLTFAEVVDAS